MSAGAPSASVPRRPVPWAALALSAAIVAGVVLSAVRLGFDPFRLFTGEGLDALGAWCAKLRGFDLSSAALANAARGAWETFAISLVGTAIGAVIGVALLPWASRVLHVEGPLVDDDRPFPSRAFAWTMHQSARLLANGLRTVPYLVWAMLLIVLLRIGPFPGAVAIGLHTGGVLSRLYATALDHADMRPLEALRAAGASPFRIFVWGALPQCRAPLASYTLYRFEVNVREAAVLGIVGAGGIGRHLKDSLDWFDYRAFATYLVAVMALVLTVDVLSAAVRKRLL